jgi:hypothetical protein
MHLQRIDPEKLATHTPRHNDGVLERFRERRDSDAIPE